MRHVSCAATCTYCSKLTASCDVENAEVRSGLDSIYHHNHNYDMMELPLPKVKDPPSYWLTALWY